MDGKDTKYMYYLANIFNKKSQHFIADFQWVND